TQALPTAPYHFEWSPAQDQIGLLRVDSVDTVQLALVDAALAAAQRHVGGGAPVNAGWSPDGSRLFLRIDDQLLLVDRNGTTTPLGVLVAPSGAPAWVDAGTLLVAIDAPSGRRLVRLDVATRATTDVLTYDGSI